MRSAAVIFVVMGLVGPAAAYDPCGNARAAAQITGQLSLNQQAEAQATAEGLTVGTAEYTKRAAMLVMSPTPEMKTTAEKEKSAVDKRVQECDVGAARPPGK